MFGTYRLILACFVALSHFGLIVAGFNPGQWAVLSFYVVSGYLMEHQFQRLSPHGEYRFFYLDRFLRLYPVFIVVLLLTSLATSQSLGNILISSTLFPLNYNDFTSVPLIIAPSNSLACEAHFYLLVPFLALLPKTIIRLLAALSIGLFVISPLLPSPDFWGFIGLPGILFAFLSGILIKRRDVRFLGGMWFLFVALLAGFAYTKFSHRGLSTGIHINVCIGYLLAVPMVHWLSAYSPKVHWDIRLGLLSYPLFLVHVPLKNYLGVHFGHLSASVMLLLSLLAAGLLVLLVEKPMNRLRHRLQARAPAKQPAPDSAVN